MMPISSQQRLAIARRQKEGPPEPPVERVVLEDAFELAQWNREREEHYAEKKRKEDEFWYEWGQRDRAQMLRQVGIPEDEIAEIISKPPVYTLTPKQQRQYEANIAASRLRQDPGGKPVRGYISVEDGMFHQYPDNP